jgi:hypothetical protein
MSPQRNDGIIDTLRTEYVSLYAPTTTWGSIISMNLGLPVLRGYWSFTSVDEGGDIYDLSEQDRVMTNSVGP